MDKYIIFGAGNFGAQAAELIGIDKVEFFIDNNSKKQGKMYLDCKVISLKDAIKFKDEYTIVVAIADEYISEIESQLIENGVSDYKRFNEIKYNIIKEKLKNRPDYIAIYDRAIGWINNNIVDNKGITCTSKLKKPYPEVSGYYIPTLIRWGYKDIAIDFAKWLCSIQKPDGSWYDTEDEFPYIFDSAQIIKGLIAIRECYPEVDDCIIKGCDWILSNMEETGALKSPIKDAWGDGKTFSELIHTYCISPIKEAGQIFGRNDYIEKAKKIADYYTTNCKDQILHFDLLSHFYAYVMEAMVDIGREDVAKEAMGSVALLQKESGAVPAYNNVDWVCSTGLFQLAIVWFRLGDVEKGNKAFEYACRLQNQSGGWYGSYVSEENPNETNTYFPDAEISWAVKYFLDALYYKTIAEFDEQAYMFGEKIEISDGRYECVRDAVTTNSTEGGYILDIGCGKGRYTKNLLSEIPERNYYAVDISDKVMQYINDDRIIMKQGNLTNIPYSDNFFDVVFTCEALEHAVDIKSAVKELCRVTRPGGTVVIIDKNKDKLGVFEIEEWEQWFDEKELSKELKKYCDEVDVIKEIPYEGKAADGLFYCWKGIVK